MPDPDPPAAEGPGQAVAPAPAAEPTSSQEQGGRRPAGPHLSLLGVLIAAWSSMCGIGGGLFAVPVLHFLERLPLKEAVATSLGLVATTASFATLSELVHPDSALRWGVVIPLAAGSLVGAQLGFRAAQRVRVGPLRVVFVVLTTVVGLRLLLTAGGGGGAAEGELSVDLLHGAAAAGIGLAAGFVSPLLGIGGGLVAVPSLLYGLPALGYQGARACALGMATVASLRSLGLYLSKGMVDGRRALWLAAGAAVGGVVGARLVHLDALEPYARRMLGLTLLFVAARFGRDVWRSYGVSHFPPAKEGAGKAGPPPSPEESD
jgi:uncharacterized membrane protein YfcA